MSVKTYYRKAPRGEALYLSEPMRKLLIQKLDALPLMRCEFANLMGITSNALAQILSGRTSCAKKHQNFFKERLGIDVTEDVVL